MRSSEREEVEEDEEEEEGTERSDICPIFVYVSDPKYVFMALICRASGGKIKASARRRRRRRGEVEMK
jgi:hypothetical protein